MILMQAPQSDMAFGSLPSGASYVSNQYGLIFITNNSTADQAALAAAGCFTLSPFGGWGTYGFSTLVNLYAADLATGLVQAGQTGFPEFTMAVVYNDPTVANNGTWAKSSSGNGSGNWTYVAAIPSSGALAAAAAALQAGNSASAAAGTLTSLLSLIAAGGMPVFTSAANALATGIVGLAVTANGSAGAAGTFTGTFTGGGGSGAQFQYVVASGAVVPSSVVLTNKGAGYTSTPTPVFTASSGLTGVTATVTTGANTTSGQYFVVPNAANSSFAVYENMSGAASLQFIVGGTNIDSISFTQSPFSYVVYGTDGNLLFGIQAGSYPGMVVDGITENNPVRYPKSSLNLGGTLVGYTGGGGDWAQSGRVWTIAGSDGNELGGIDDAAFPQPTGAFSPHRNAKPEYVAHPTNGWELFSRRDSNNCMQVWSRNVSLGISAVKLSEAGADNITPHFDATGNRAVWNTGNKDRWFSNQLRARLLSGAAPVGHAYPSLNLTVIGDSIANGTGATTSANAFAYLTATAENLTMNMRAVGGQQVWQQAMIVGAIPIVLTLASTSITTGGVNVSAISTVHPATGATPSCTVQGMSGVSLYPNTLLLSSGANNTTNTLNATMVDVSGNTQPVVLTRTANAVPSTVETYTLSSNAGVTITAASTTVTIVPTGPSTGQSPNGIAIGDQHNAVMIYEGGVNDFSQGIFATNITPPAAATIATDIEAVQDAIIALNASAMQAFAVVGVYNPASSWAIAGSAGDLAIAAFNANRAAKYPGRFVNAFAILAAGNNGSTQDLSDVANHYIPTSERYDVTHPNNTGHANIANGNSGGAGVISVLAAQIAAIPTS